MKTAIKTHFAHVGPEINIDLADVMRIEMHGQRESQAGWVTTKITTRSEPQAIEARMAPEDHDQLVTDWMG